MKVKDFIKKLETLDQEAKVYFLQEHDTGEEFHFDFAVCENQVRREKELIERYYTIEKRE